MNIRWGDPEAKNCADMMKLLKAVITFIHIEHCCWPDKKFLSTFVKQNLIIFVIKTNATVTIPARVVHEDCNLYQ